MRREILTAAVCCTLFGSGMVWADDAVKPNMDKDAIHQADMKPMPMRASQLIGMNIYNHDNQKVGDVDDIVIDGGANKIAYIVVSNGGFLGMGDKLFAVPYRALEHRPIDKDKLFLNISKDTMKSTQGFDKNNWPDVADPTFRKNVDMLYPNAADQTGWNKDKDTVNRAADAAANAGVNPGAANGAKAGDATARNDAAAGDKMVVQGPTDKGLVWSRRYSAITGANVNSPADEKLGDVKDLVYDVRDGSISYAVLSYGGWLGMNDKLFAIPFRELTSKADQKVFVLNVSKDQLKNAPGFDKNNWPDFADPTIRSNIDTYYKHDDTRARTD